MTISEVLPSLSLSFPICTMGWGIRLCDFFPQALMRVSQGKPSLLSAAPFPESGLQRSSLFHPASLTLLSLLPCVRQEVSGEAFCTEQNSPQRGKPRQDSHHTVALAQRARPSGSSGWPSSTTLVNPIPYVFSELGREQGRPYPFDSAEKEKGGQEMWQDQSEVTQWAGQSWASVFLFWKMGRNPLPLSYATSMPQIQALLLNSLWYWARCFTWLCLNIPVCKWGG